MKHLLMFTISFTLILQSVCLSQEAGKLITRQEAEDMFGPVSSSVILPKDIISGLLHQTDKYLMFEILNGQAVILADNRIVLFPSGFQADPQEIFHVFSLSIIKQFLAAAVENLIAVEKRADVLTLTNGDVTLEFSIPCPPYCD